MDNLRVIQWTTGKVGRLALRGILDDPRLELAGVYAHSDDKAGVDAGKLCGRPDCGVLATNDIDGLIALGADTVIYSPFTADLSHLIRLLESGHDVISTNLLLNVGGIQGEVAEKLEAACRHGDSSLYISGINPGWANAITTALTAICRKVDSVGMVECADCSVYESVETWTYLGMGLPEATPEVLAAARSWMIMFRDVVVRIADALQIKLDGIDFSVEYATAARKVDLGWFCMEKDTNAAVRAGWNGRVNGEAVVSTRVVWYLTKDLNEGWDIDEDQYRMWVKGEPSVNARIHVERPEHWTNRESDTVTAMAAVNAVFDIKAARPGILGLKDAGLPSAPAGVWMG